MSKLEFTKGTSIRWDKKYQTDEGYHWSLSSDESNARGCTINAHLVLMTTSDTDFYGTPMDKTPDMQLIAEAFNVANETGLSPREMKDKLDEAAKAIERLKKQVELCDYRDSLGHELRMNAAYLDLITLP
jgi:hypothetical protein